MASEREKPPSRLKRRLTALGLAGAVGVGGVHIATNPDSEVSPEQRARGELQTSRDSEARRRFASAGATLEIPSSLPASSAAVSRPTFAAIPQEPNLPDKCDEAVIKKLKGVWTASSTGFGAQAYEGLKLIEKALLQQSNYDYRKGFPDDADYKVVGTNRAVFQRELQRTGFEAAQEYLQIALDKQTSGKDAFKALLRLDNALTDSVYGSNNTLNHARDVLCSVMPGSCVSHESFPAIRAQAAKRALDEYRREFDPAKFTSRKEYDAFLTDVGNAAVELGLNFVQVQHELVGSAGEELKRKFPLSRNEDFAPPGYSVIPDDERAKQWRNKVCGLEPGKSNER